MSRRFWLKLSRITIVLLVVFQTVSPAVYSFLPEIQLARAEGLTGSTDNNSLPSEPAESPLVNPTTELLNPETTVTPEPTVTPEATVTPEPTTILEDNSPTPAESLLKSKVSMAENSNQCNGADQYTLEGRIKGTNAYTSGNLCQANNACWAEGEQVPVRLTMTGLVAATAYTVFVEHDWKNAGDIVGYSQFQNPSSSNGSATNISFSEAIEFNCNPETCKAYTLSFTAIQPTVVLDWFALLGDDAAAWNGATLQYRLTAGTCGESVGNKTVPIDPAEKLQTGSIKLIKSADNGVVPADWKFSLSGDVTQSNIASGTTINDIPIDKDGVNLTISESGPYGWFLNNTIGGCTKVGTTNTATAVLSAENPDIECTFVNNILTPKLQLRKLVTNDNGGTLNSTNFKLNVFDSNGLPVQGSPFTGSETYLDIYLTAGSYTVMEERDLGYMSSFSGDCGADGRFTINNGDTKFCTVTNDDQPAKVKVVKEVVGGSLTPAEVSLYLNGQSVATGVVNTVNAGDYTVSEDPVSGYSATFSGDCDSTGALSVGVGEEKTCTITNTRDSGSIKVTKMLDTDADGVYESGDNEAANLGMVWNILQKDVAFGVSESSLEIGEYSISENDVANYHFVGWYELDDAERSCANPEGTSLPIEVEIKTKDELVELVLCNAHDTGELKVQKMVDDNSDRTAWSFALNGGKPIQADAEGIVDFGKLLSGVSYTVTESGNSEDYQISGVTGAGCSWTSGTSFSATVASDEKIYCLVNNQVNKSSLTITKKSLPASAQLFSFNLSDNERSGNFELQDNGNENDGKKSYVSLGQLMPGTYTITEASQNGWSLTGIVCQEGDETIASGLVGSVTVELSAGHSVSCTFTNVKLSDIVAEKFSDVNADQDRDWGDRPVPNWEMTLYSGYDCVDENQVTGMPTNNLGRARFSNLLPGQYSVAEEARDDWSATGATCKNVNLTSFRNDTVEFGNFKNTSISGVKWSDDDADGRKDRREALVPDWMITLSRWDGEGWEFVSQTKTDENGWYVFSNLPFGKYKVTEDTDVAGWKAINPAKGYHVVELRGNTPVELNFGNQPQASITVDKVTYPAGAYEFFDFKIKSGFETSAHFSLRDGSKTKRVELVANKTYSVTERGEYGWDQTAVNCTDAEGESYAANAIELTPGLQVTCVFENTKRGVINVWEYEDNDVSGTWEWPAEGFLKDWTISLYSGYDCSEVAVKSDNTNFMGFSAFNNLKPGQYSIGVTGLAGWTPVGATCRNIDLEPGGYKFLSFGAFQNTSISGIKWADENTDGIMNDTEVGVPGWLITLFKEEEEGDTMIASIATDNQGFYTFDNVGFGTYKIVEETKAGWRAVSPASGERSNVIVGISGTPVTNQDFGNQSIATIQVIKYANPAERDFNFDIFKNGAWEAEVTAGPDNNPVHEFRMGTYQVFEQAEAGWINTYKACYKNEGQVFAMDPAVGFYLNPGDAVVCEYVNSKLGVVDVTKFNDINGNGLFDENEPTLPDWEVSLREFEGYEITALAESESEPYSASLITDNTGMASFKDLNVGYYELSETQQPGWKQTGISCEELSGGDYWEEAALKPLALKPREADQSEELMIFAGAHYSCFIGNQLPVLRIEKTHNRLGQVLPAGSDVTFTIKVSIPEELHGFTPAQLEQVVMTDLYSEGFKYRAGSWTSSKPGVPEPEYHSPGAWQIGAMEPGETVTLSYIADIDSGIGSGLYKDLSWAQGIDGLSEGVLATNNSESSYFANTAVAVAAPVNYMAQAVDLETVVERTLPRTGSEVAVLIFAAVTALFGSVAVAFGIVLSKKQNNFGRKTLAIVVLTFVAGLGLAVLQPAQALNSLMVEIQEPAPLVNEQRIEVTFLALDLNKAPVTAVCYYRAPGTADFTEFSPELANLGNGGNSSRCILGADKVLTDGEYAIFVKANGVASETVSVTVDTAKPEAPVSYAKTRIDDCTYRIDFKTAADGGNTQKIHVFRSETPEFVVNLNAPYLTKLVGSDSADSVTDTTPVCEKTYYYVVQSADLAGNLSGFRGDEVVVVNTITPTPATQGAVTPGGSTASGTGTANGATGNGTTGQPGVSGAVVNPSGIAIDTTNAEGAVLGDVAANGATDNTAGTQPLNLGVFLLVVAIGGAILGGVAYVVSAKK